jgi:hypothetical protein
LDDGLARLGDFALFSSAVGAVFAELLGTAFDFDALQFLDVFSAAFANRHVYTSAPSA